MKPALHAAIVSLAGCAGGSPLSRVSALVWVDSDPTASPPTLQVEIGAIEQLDVLADAVAAGEIRVTLDNRPLVLDPRTGYTQQGGSYSAFFDLPQTAALARARPAPGDYAARPRILITDGTAAWQGEFGGLFVNDLAPVAPVAPGENTFEWPSATLTNDGVPEIQTGCLEVVGRSSHCVTYGDPATPDGISQQYLTLMNDARPGDTIRVTAERWDDAPGDQPQMIARIKGGYTTTQR